MSRLASVTLLLASACTTPGTAYYGGDDTPIDNGGGGGGSGCTMITTVTPVAPLIQLVVDGSGTMNQNGKYSAIQSALYDSTSGLLLTLQDKAQFGATAYTYTGGGTCPSSVKSSACTLNNLAGVKAAIDGQKNQDGTDPLKEALDQLHTSLGSMTNEKDRNIVIVTDGTNNGCAGSSGGNDAIASATTLYNDGVRSYIIGFGNLGTWGQGMANAGIGGTGTLYNASTGTLKTIYGQVFDTIIDCRLSTDMAIDVNKASTGMLSMNGSSLVYTTDWTVVDDHTIQLSAAQCTAYKALSTAPTFTASICGT